jgi:hypothetical protein
MVCAVAIAAAGARSQPEAKGLAFEVDSVKAAKPGAAGFVLPAPRPGGQSYRTANSPLMVMAMSAYRITDSQILARRSG